MEDSAAAAAVEKMKRYLYGELNSAHEEEEAFERELFENGELFENLQRLEDDLFNRYAAGLMNAEECRRFEAGLIKFPARQEKLATALALQNYIRTVKSSENAASAVSAQATTAFAEPKRPRRAAIFNLFDLGNPAAFQLAGAGALLLLLTIGGVWLFYRNQNLPAAEMAQNAADKSESQANERDSANANEIVPQNQNVENSRTVQNLKSSPAEAADEKSRPGETESPQNRESLKKPVLPAQTRRPAEIKKVSSVLSVALSPLRRVRANGNAAAGGIGAAQIKLPAGAKFVNLRLEELPAAAAAAVGGGSGAAGGETAYEVRLNGASLGSNFNARPGRGGYRFLNIKVAAARLKATNSIVVVPVGSDAGSNSPGSSEINYRLEVVQ